MTKGIIIGCSMGNCVHVAGAAHFLNLAEDEGYETLFLGPAVSVDDIISSIEENKPVMVTLGYRLTPENGVKIVKELIEKSKKLTHTPKWLFGGTPPVAEKVNELGFFDVIFDGTDDIDDSITLLRTGEMPSKSSSELYAGDLVGRLAQKNPYPLLRHHFGLPSFDETVKGVEEIAESRVLDVISLGIDQNTQQYYFHPEKRNKIYDGAGGVPVRNEAEFSKLKEASQRGNFPLMRCYSGTADVIKLADVLTKTLANAWCAVPLCWYNELDGRGLRTLQNSMEEAAELIAHHGKKNIPVELNEPHHWGLRDAHDTISVAMSYISALNAKKLGVKDYISQYMFNVPNSLSFSMDLAKTLAQIKLTESLADSSFRVYRQTRAGLPFLSADAAVAKGQLAASTALQMNVRPHIIHVVGYSEALHAATPNVVIESSKIVRGVVRSALSGAADSTQDPSVKRRRDELLKEASYLINFIKEEYSSISQDPLCDPKALTDCIKRGILDAPHIVKKGEFKGNLQTRVRDGKNVAWDSEKQKAIDEKTRLEKLTGKALQNTGAGIL
ncbi:MAG: cobalamin B12-binding domain-containing protein [Oscillospiraceae bacterium]|nr:cobalamin B12-binding domain-containing protein [Oscillospiraceae bacterium]MCL2248319.1 cobalamin B12-binding domain-containing protein [Oscillospiraceae bacterium]